MVHPRVFMSWETQHKSRNPADGIIRPFTACNDILFWDVPNSHLFCNLDMCHVAERRQCELPLLSFWGLLKLHHQGG